VPDRDLRAIVADDEQLARDELCYLIGEVEGVAVVAQAGNGLDALDAISKHNPTSRSWTCRCPA
jgi:DNA-binding LytR/AlgR family response regulator